MKYYCGIDLHSRDCFLCVIDDNERTLVSKKLPNDLKMILDQLCQFDSMPIVVVESTLNWYWLVDGLQEAGLEVKLAHPLGLFMITGAKVKTDKRDAFVLARLLRLNAIPEAYIYPRNKRVIRDLLRKRHKLVARRAVEYFALRRMLYQYGFDGFSTNEIKKFTKQQVTEYFDDPYLQCDCLFLLERIQLLSRQIKILEEGILSNVEDEMEFQLLQTVPGIGKILALTILLEAGDMQRFATHRHFCSYARVVPGIAQSSGSAKRGRGSKQGSAHLKNSFSQAASLAAIYNPTIRKFRQKHMARRRSKARKLISNSIVAHKLAIAAYHILKKQEPFREELMFRAFQEA